MFPFQFLGIYIGQSGFLLKLKAIRRVPAGSYGLHCKHLHGIDINVGLRAVLFDKGQLCTADNQAFCSLTEQRGRDIQKDPGICLLSMLNGSIN